MRRAGLSWTGALAVVLAVTGWSGSAHALSFPLAPGDRIRDIDFSGSVGSLVYDGTSETLTVEVQANRIELCGDPACTTTGPILELDQPDQVVVFMLSVQLVTTPQTLFIEDSGGAGSLAATYANGAAADFSLVDTLFGPPGGTLLLAGDFGPGGLDMSMTDFFGLVSGSLLASYQVVTGDPGFLAAISPTGGLVADFTGLQRSGVGLTSICEIADDPCDPPIAPGTPWPGLRDFTAQAGLDLSPDGVPEPAAGWLLAVGVGALLAGRERRRV